MKEFASNHKQPAPYMHVAGIPPSPGVKPVSKQCLISPRTSWNVPMQAKPALSTAGVKKKKPH